jgi:hypothetical protein
MPRHGVTSARPAAGIIAVAAIALLAGCAPGLDPPPPPLPDDIAVSFVQLRSDVAARQAQLEVHNGTDEAIEVGAVTVTDPRFADIATRVFDRTSKVPAGGTVDIRIQLPDMACDTTEGEMTVQLTLIGATDDLREARLPDELDVIAPLHERECRAQALAQAADVSIASFTPSPSGSPADLVLEVAPTGEASARIVDIQDTNLLTFAGTQPVGYPIDVTVAPGDSQATSVHLPLVPLRCDPHAVQEDKRGTIFTFDVEIDGVPGTVEIASSEDMRGEILTWVGDWCGFGAG